MERTKDDKKKNLRFTIALCILCAGGLGIVGIYHLIAFDRSGDYFVAAASIGMICPLIIVYRNLK